MDKPLRGPALSQAIRDYVKGFILEHNLSAGDPLPPETQLAQDLGVGRSSVREAIKALQSLGIVEVRHGDGLYVREYNFDPISETLSYGIRFDPAALAELFQIRIWLEGAVIEDAVKQISAEEMSELESVIAAWETRVEAGEPDTDLDERFHYILQRTVKNKSLLKLFKAFWIAFESLDIEIIHDSDPRLELENHRAILQAVKSRDIGLARQRLAQHFSHLQDRIHQAIQLEQITEKGDKAVDHV
jgi:DNA-binding FadR family transcriptional regulator